MLIRDQTRFLFISSDTYSYCTQSISAAVITLRIFGKNDVTHVK